MSAEAKAKKLAARLELARQAEKKAAEAQKKKVREEEISQPKQQLKRKPATCKRCHKPQKGVCRKMNAKTGQVKNCEDRGDPACTSFATCKYRPGHQKEATAANKVAKLEERSREAELAAEAEVRISFGPVLIVC